MNRRSFIHTLSGAGIAALGMGATAATSHGWLTDSERALLADKRKLNITLRSNTQALARQLHEIAAAKGVTFDDVLSEIGIDGDALARGLRI